MKTTDLSLREKILQTVIIKVDKNHFVSDQVGGAFFGGEIITEAEEGFLCGTGCFFIMPSDGLFAPYFIRLLQTTEMRECLRQGSVGSTMDNLNHSILENLPIPLPPLAEQKRIAETLERVLGVL